MNDLTQYTRAQLAQIEAAIADLGEEPSDPREWAICVDCQDPYPLDCIRIVSGVVLCDECHAEATDPFWIALAAGDAAALDRIVATYN